jgi:hypothetical protein
VDPPPVTAPTNLVATVDGRKINLSWDENATGQVWFLVEELGWNGNYYPIDWSSSTTDTISWLRPGQTDSFEIVAIDRDGWSAPSNSVTATTVGRTQTLFQATSVGSGMSDYDLKKTRRAN